MASAVLFERQPFDQVTLKSERDGVGRQRKENSEPDRQQQANAGNHSDNKEVTISLPR